MDISSAIAASKSGTAEQVNNGVTYQAKVGQGYARLVLSGNYVPFDNAEEMIEFCRRPGPFANVLKDGWEPVETTLDTFTDNLAVADTLSLVYEALACRKEREQTEELDDMCGRVEELLVDFLRYYGMLYE